MNAPALILWFLLFAVCAPTVIAAATWDVDVAEKTTATGDAGMTDNVAAAGDAGMTDNVAAAGDAGMADNVAATGDAGMAEKITASDSARIFPLNEVTVTGSRIATDVNRLPSPVSIITRQTMDDTNGSTVAEMLHDVPGVFFKIYGGAGALQTISSRGMGPEYTLVLVDGQRFTNYQNGQVDLGVVSTADIDRIEIAKGGFSALFGADGVGGVVNIITKKPSHDVHASFSAGVGSLGFQHYQVSLSGSTGVLALKGMFRNEHSSNAFDCYFHDGARRIRVQRSNSDYALNVANISAQVPMGSAVLSTLSLRYSNADRGVPSPLTSLTSAGAARLRDDEYFAQHQTEWRVSENSELSLKANMHYSEQHYNDPLLVTGGTPLAGDFVNRSAIVTPTYRLSPGLGQTLIVGIEFVRAWIESNEVQKIFRTQFSAFASTQHEMLFNALLPLDITVFPSVRYDRFSDVEQAVNPRIGINIGSQESDALRARASIGRNYRIPTFNDLYWTTGGNPDLKSERSVSYDAGLVASLRAGCVLECEATYYSIDTKDRIVWMPGAHNLWSPKNISRVVSQGVELSARLRLWDERVLLAYVQNISHVVNKSDEQANGLLAGRQLPYLPVAFGSFTASGSVNPCTLTIRVAVTGERFSTEDNNPRYALPPFVMAEANVNYKFMVSHTAVNVKLEADNLFNADYQIIALQPMPLRSFRVSCELGY